MALTLVWIILLPGITTSHTYSKIGQSLTAIPTDIPTETIFVDLTMNKIHQITDSDFSTTTLIEKLKLINNHLDTISDNGLTPLTKLTLLYLSSNRFISMPMLEPVSATLKILKVDNNQITYLKADYFINFIGLTLLDLTRNLIHTLQENAFVGLSNLTKLLLGYNHITCVNRTLLDGMNALKYLDISLNQLAGFLSESCPFVANETTLTPTQLPKLDKLILVGNALTEVPDLRGAPMLYTILLMANQFTDVNLHHLAGLSNLYYMCFSENNMKHFPNLSAILDPNDNKLNIIYFRMNQVSVIDDDTFKNLIHLKRINLNTNRLQSLSFLSKHKAVLELISIVSNNLEDLNSMELGNGSWEKLIKIDAASNRITHISNILLDQLPALKILNLSYNRISIFPELSRIGLSLKDTFLFYNNISWVNVSSLVGLSKIVRLELHQNNLTTFPLSVFTQLSTIKDITLAKNQITYVEELSPDVMASSDLKVTLTDNPFNCDQMMVWIKMLNTSKLTVTLSPNPCASPPALISVPWASINAEDLGISKIVYI